MAWDFDAAHRSLLSAVCLAPCTVCGRERELNRAIMICIPCQRAALDVEEALCPVCTCSEQARDFEGKFQERRDAHAPYCPLRIIPR